MSDQVFQAIISNRFFPGALVARGGTRERLVGLIAADLRVSPVVVWEVINRGGVR